MPRAPVLSSCAPAEGGGERGGMAKMAFSLEEARAEARGSSLAGKNHGPKTKGMDGIFRIGSPPYYWGEVLVLFPG